MNYRKLLRPFKKKMFLESIVKATLYAIMTGSCAVFLVSLGYHIAIKSAPAKLLLLVFAIVCLVTFLLLFILRLYPTKKRVAKRIDETGLQERALTMLEYREEDTEMAKLQREDAETRISQMDPKQMKFRFQRRTFGLCLASICLAVVMLMIPYDILSFTISESKRMEEEQEKIVKELIEQLRKEVKEAELSEDLEEQLNEIIDELERDLEESESELERAAKIEQAKEEMQELLEKEVTKNRIGAALQMYDLTKPLGVAVSEGDTEAVSIELDNLENTLNTYQGMVAMLNDNIVSALTDSGVDAENELYVAFDEFATDLNAIAERLSNNEEVETELKEAFDTAETAINAALEKQTKIEEKIEEMQEALSEAKDDLLGKEEEELDEESDGEQEDKQESEDQEGESNQEQQGEQQGDQQGQRPEGDMQGQGQGEGNGEGNTMTEGIYDPTSGNVSYGEVFAAYYAEYLKALENGEVTEELQKIMDQYFSSLN